MSEPTTAPPHDDVGKVEASARRLAITGAGSTTVWRRWGKDGALPPLVLLHGGSGSWNHWLRNVAVLAEKCAVWVPDMPGYGDSGDVPAGATPRDLAALLADALDALLPAGRSFQLVGFSFGSIVAAHLAALRPNRVGRLVLVGSTGWGTPRDGQPPLQRWRGVHDAGALERIHRHNLAALMLADPQRVDATAVALQAANVARTRYVSKRVSRGDEMLRALAGVEAPVFGIWGSRDATAIGRVLEQATLLQQHVAEAQYLVIEDAGHWVQYEKPDEFNRALTMVLAGS